MAGDTTALPEIVVTATRYPVAADSVASTVTVLRGDDLRAQGIRFVADALRQVPGAHVVQSGPFGSTTSLFLRGGESDYVKVLIDGAPVNQPGGFYDFGSLTTDNVERIEVLRGPASVLYGSDAITGVIQIVTRRGGEGLRLSAAGEGGTFGSARWEASALGGSDAVDWSASLSRLTSDGSYEFNNDYRNTVASGRVGAGSRRSHQASASAATTTTRCTTSPPTSPARRWTRISSPPTRPRPSRSTRTTGSRKPWMGSCCCPGATSRTASRIPPIPPRTPRPAAATRSTSTRTSADARMRLRLPAGFEGFAGGSFEAQRQGVAECDRGPRQLRGIVRPGPPALPVSRLQLTASGRMDDNEQFGTFWTWRAAALAFASPTTRLRASAGSGFKEPSFFENFDSPFSIGNPDLRPERTVSYEAGIEQDLFRGVARVGVTGFVQHFRDLIQFTFVTPEPGGPNYFNVASADANGLEAVLQAGTAAVRGTLSYTHLWTEVTDAGFDAGDAAAFVEGERLLRRPDDAVSAHVETTVAERARLGATVTWSGPRDDIRFGQFPEPNQRVELPSYTTVDLSSVVTVLPAGRRAIRPRSHRQGGEPVRRAIRAVLRVPRARTRRVRRDLHRCPLAPRGSPPSCPAPRRSFARWAWSLPWWR